MIMVNPCFGIVPGSFFIAFDMTVISNILFTSMSNHLVFSNKIQCCISSMIIKYTESLSVYRRVINGTKVLCISIRYGKRYDIAISLIYSKYKGFSFGPPTGLLPFLWPPITPHLFLSLQTVLTSFNVCYDSS